MVRIFLTSLCLIPGDVGCPVFSDETIVQQPADFLNLTNSYVYNAIQAIKKAKGLLVC